MWKRKSARWLFSLAFLTAAGALCAGCTFQVPKDSTAMVRTLGTDPETLNPILANSSVALEVCLGLIYEQLFELDNETLLPIPLLAKRWDVSKDKLQYTFYLREDVKWEDGQPLTAEDVLYTYQKIQDPKVDAAVMRSSFQEIVSAEKLNDFTVRFRLKRPFVGAMYTLGLMPVIPKHVFDDDSDFNTHPRNRNPLGSGPLHLMEWQTGRRITLNRREEYWGKNYKVSKMIFKIIPDAQVSFQLFKKKELDLVGLTSLQWAKQTQSKKFQENFSKHRFFTPFGAFTYIGWNLEKPCFKDRRVRLALAHLIDRESMNEKLGFGLRQLITGPFYPLGLNYDPTLKQIPYDLNAAQKLLEEAGWVDNNHDGVREKEGIPLRFELMFGTGSPFYEQLSAILEKNFSKAGIDLQLRRLDDNTKYKLVEEHQFDALIGGWGRGGGVEDYFQIFHSSQSKKGSNFIGYSNPQVDRLMEEARQEFDPKKRGDINRRVHRFLYEDQPYLFLYAHPELYARDRRFQNVREYPIGFDMREWEVF